MGSQFGQQPTFFGDDIGTWNVSAYHRGMMGGRTPNIDRVAREGALFTDYYSQNSCAAGLLKVGLPGAKQDKDPTIAGLAADLPGGRGRFRRQAEASHWYEGRSGVDRAAAGPVHLGGIDHTATRPPSTWIMAPFT
jgi:hypothetical protein